MKIKVFALVALLALLCCGCTAQQKNDKNSSNPNHTEIVTDYGDKITLNLIETDFPDVDKELYIYVPREGDDDYYCYIFLTQDNYVYDHIDSYDFIINKYEKGDVRAYEFYWGLVYTIDNGRNFSVVKKEDYEHIYNFKDIYDLTT